MDDTPRRLTIEEIKELSKNVSPPQIAGEELRQHTHKEILLTLQHQLRIIEIRPSKIKDLGNYLANKSLRSFVEPGMPVGFNAAESVGQPATQLVLNTFHSAGQLGQNPFVRFYSNIQLKAFKSGDAESNMKNTMKIHMNDKNWSYEDLYIYSQRFVSISMYDLLDKSDMISQVYPFDTDTDVYTDDFKKINVYTDDGGAIRLKFDKELLFLHQIPLENIANEISSTSDFDVTVFSGPQYTGIIDVYPRKVSICEDDDKSMEECVEIFKNGPFMNYLKMTELGKYPYIHGAMVNKVPILSLIKDVTYDYDEDMSKEKNRIRVWTDNTLSIKDGIPMEKLEDLIRITGYKIVDKDEMFLTIDSDNINIKKDLTKIVHDEDDKLKNDFFDTGILTTSDLYRTAFYNYIITKGSELEKIRIEDDVDEINTISNSVMEIYDVLGIEVARNYLEKEIFDLFTQNNQNISPRNISMIVDWMTYRTRPISLNPKSIPKSESSILRAISFENPKDHFARGAVLGKEELISNVSARITFGLRQTLGTGCHDIIPDPTVIQHYINQDNISLTRLTSDTLDKVKSDDTMVTSYLPSVNSSLFGTSDIDNLSKGSEIVF